MKVTRVSPLTQIAEERDLQITPQQLEAYRQGALIQIAFPDLSKEDREFFKTGYTEDDWRLMFSEDAIADIGIMNSLTRAKGNLKGQLRAFIGLEPDEIVEGDK